MVSHPTEVRTCSTTISWRGRFGLMVHHRLGRTARRRPGSPWSRPRSPYPEPEGGRGRMDPDPRPDRSRSRAGDAPIEHSWRCATHEWRCRSGDDGFGTNRAHSGSWTRWRIPSSTDASSARVTRRSSCPRRVFTVPKWVHSAACPSPTRACDYAWLVGRAACAVSRAAWSLRVDQHDGRTLRRSLRWRVRRLARRL